MEFILHPLVRPAPLTERIYREVKASIQTSKLRPGDCVREADLCTQFKVSRTPVRQALHRLQHEGLIETKDGGGFAVATLTREDIEEIYQLRMVLEVAAAEVAATNPCKAGPLRAIGEAIKASKRAIDAADAAGFIEANRQFRNAWLGLVPNRRLIGVVKMYAGHVRALQATTLTSPSRQREVLAVMREIEGAIRRGDPAETRAAMEKYLGVAHRAMTELVEFREITQADQTRN